MKTINITGNRDTGSVNVGKSTIKPGDRVQVVAGGIETERRERIVSYVTSNRQGELQVYTRGFGPFPLGNFQLAVPGEETTVNGKEVQA